MLQKTLQTIYRSKPFEYWSNRDHRHSYGAAKIFASVPSSQKAPETWKETFYLRFVSKEGGSSVLWMRTPYQEEQKLTIDVRAMEAFDPECIWRLCPITVDGKTQVFAGGLLVSGKHASHCVRFEISSCKSKLDSLVAIPIEQATMDDLWTYDAKSNQWSCPNGMLFHTMCDHDYTNRGKYYSWSQVEFEPVLTKDVNAALERENITWDVQLCSLPKFCLN